MHELLKVYQKRLTNLTGNNRSLLLLRLVSDQFLDIHDLDFINNRPSFQIIDELVSRKEKIKIARALDSRDSENNILSAKLKKLQRADKFIYEERGSRDLYVGWPFLWGRFTGGPLVRCPLVFFPVDVKLLEDEWFLVPRRDVNITFNKTFLLAYAHFNQITIGDELLEWVFDENEKESRVFRTSLYQIFKESPIELNFNQDNFKDALDAFHNFRKDEFLEQTKEGQFKLFPEAVLGIFPQSGSHLVPDYEYLIEHTNLPDLEEFFVQKKIDNDLNQKSGRFRFASYMSKVKEEQTYVPFKIDGYQENALKAIKRGNSLVVQGPPGTGKSQLICNLIADAIANNKKVLLVSQKRAALDVVYDRLEKRDFSDFVALLHDFKSDRKSIYEKIADQINNVYDYQLKNNSLDAIELERDFLSISRVIDQISEELEEYREALFDDAEAGVTIKELYLTSSLIEPWVSLKQQFRFFPISKVDDFLRRLGLYARYHFKIEKADHPWKNRKSFHQNTVHDLLEIKKRIREIPKVQQDLKEVTSRIIHTPIDFDAAAQINVKRRAIASLRDDLTDDQVFEFFKAIVPYKDKDTDQLWLANIERIVIDCFKGVGPEISLKAEDLGRFQEALEHGMKARKGLFSWIRWRLFSKDKYFISRVIIANGLRNNKIGFDTLVQKIDNRLNLEHYLTRLKTKPWLINLPRSLNKADYQTWFHYQRKALAAKLLFTSIRNFREYFNVAKMEKTELLDALNVLSEAVAHIPACRERWEKYLSEFQIASVLDDELNAERLVASLEKDFDNLCDFDRLAHEMKVYETEVIDKLFSEAEPQNEADVEAIFMNSLKISWIEYIESKYPVLRTVSSLHQENSIKQLRDGIERKKQLSKEIVLLKARERTYRNVQYNRLNNPITYRDLQHQVTKKRKIWPVRRVISNFSDELFDILPCWMASPEAVSAIFPMKEVFDLVIFDEASQCFTERGIPAMYRGRQVVIAGDSRQLQPNDLYNIRWDDHDDEHETPELEIDSLLELASHYLPTVQLNGHYRSKRLELIDFSNRWFYKNKLRLLPDRSDVNSESTPIEYIKVDGIYENNRNTVEAAKIAEVVEGILRSQPDKEIGIVTFNSRQQYEVIEALDNHAFKRQLVIPETLIVKNIENIQGDEKDIIIFSITYAPSKSGRFLMQFGSLNVEGGENRLNVAITRAREKVILVSSIYPGQLKTEDLKNEGPRLLKEYLNYAYGISNRETTVSYARPVNSSVAVTLKSKIVQNLKKMDEVEINEELPFADLTIKSKGKYAGIIQTDDDKYFESVTIKDPYVYLPLSFSDKNWRYALFSSRRYWSDFENEMDSVERFIRNTARAYSA